MHVLSEDGLFLFLCFKVFAVKIFTFMNLIMNLTLMHRPGFAILEHGKDDISKYLRCVR